MTREPQLVYSETEDALRDGLRDLLGKHSGWQAVLARTESDDRTDRALWRRLTAEVGVAGLPIPESDDGAGASWREVAVLAEELGRAVAAVPAFGSTAVATAAILATDHRAPLAALAAGSTVACLAFPFGAGPLGRPSSVGWDGATASGTVTGVVDALAADLFLVPAVPASAVDELVLLAVPASSVRVAERVSLDMTRPLADVTVDGPGEVIATGAQARAALETAHHAGLVMLAAEEVGVAQACLDLTIEHLRTRIQFGRPLGSYQALKHRVADVWVAVVQARALSRWAADCLAAEDPDVVIAARTAAAQCADVAVLAAEECLQLHGGLGFSWEFPVHLYLKRAKSQQLAFGGPYRLRAELGALQDLQLPA